MEIENGEKNMTIEELSEKLKEIYDVAINETIKQPEILKKYKMNTIALHDLLDVEEEFFQVENLKEIVEELKTEQKIIRTGAKVGIGNALLGYIKRSMNIETKLKKDTEKDYYKRFYKGAQQVFKRVVNGEKIEDISKELNLKFEDTEEILYIYSELIRRLQAYYKRSCHKEQTMEAYQKRYFFDEEVCDYIEKQNKSTYVEKAVKLYLIRKGIILPEVEGGEHE